MPKSHHYENLWLICFFESILDILLALVEPLLVILVNIVNREVVQVIVVPDFVEIGQDDLQEDPQATLDEFDLFCTNASTCEDYFQERMKNIAYDDFQKCLQQYFTTPMQITKAVFEENEEELLKREKLNRKELNHYKQMVAEEDELGNLMKGKSCAVVGTSGIIRHSGFGSHVDMHEIIIRFGIPVQRASKPFQFASDVGRRTEVIHLNPSKANLEMGSGLRIVKAMKAKYLVVSALRGRSIYVDTKDFMQQSKAHSVNILLGSQFFSGMVEDFISDLLPPKSRGSSGLLWILYALTQCRELSLYGFCVAQTM